MTGKYADLITAIKVLEYMTVAKKQQMESEPNEQIWKDEWLQLVHTTGLLEMEKESWEEPE